MPGLDFLSLAPSLFQGGMGIFQSILGAQNKPQRPAYQVPDSIRKGTNIAENLASGNMPGMSTLSGMIDTNSGQALNTIKSGMGGSPNLGGAVADILGKTNEAKNQLSVENANFKAGAANNLVQALGTQGQYEDKKWDWNQGQKYKEQANASSALAGSGIHNMFSSLSNIAGSASYQKLYDSIFGNQDEKKTREKSTLVPTTQMNPLLFNVG